MDNQTRINNFALEIEKDLEEDANLKDNFCIIIYAGSGGTPFRNNRRVKFVYKNVEDFKNKALKDTNTIDEMHSVDMEMWVFD